MVSEPHNSTTSADAGQPSDSEIIWPPPPPSDPWAHRRGEPRIFLLLWIGWLMLITAIAFGSIGPRGIVDPDEARPATRLLLLLLFLGPSLLWPAFRLSQVRPRRIVGSVVLDIAVLVIPAQIVIWPQVLLAYWPIPVLGSIACFLGTWSILAASVLIFAFASEAARAPLDVLPRPLSRATWVLVVLVMALFAPALSLLIPGPSDPLQLLPDASGPIPLQALSPFTAAHELTADRFWTGSSSAILPQHWTALGWLFAGSFFLLMASCVYAFFAAKPDDASTPPDRPETASPVEIPV